MISIQKKFLFVHVPKTGGNSIQNILRDYSEDEIVKRKEFQDGIERFGVRNSRYKTTKHSTLSHYKSVLDSKTYRSLFKFATIRNPWDMMVSRYFSPGRGLSEWDRDDFMALVLSTPTLRDYICEKTFLERVLSRFGMSHDFKKGSLCRDIDFLIRFENIDEDFELVCRKLDIPYSELPKRNRSDRSHYSEYYDDELKETVRKKFSEEISVGNYVFENI